MYIYIIKIKLKEWIATDFNFLYIYGCEAGAKCNYYVV